MGLEFLDLGELLDGLANVPQTLGRQVGARNVLDKGAEVDARVLLCVTVRCLKELLMLVLNKMT